jgi:superfamily II DNA helicase RecQ
MKDYLPWRCERDCKKYFCDECYRNHKCWDYLTNSEKTQIAVQNTLESDKHKIETKKTKRKDKCIVKGCNTIVSGPMGIICNNCGEKLCIEHRHYHYEKCKSKNTPHNHKLLRKNAMSISNESDEYTGKKPSHTKKKRLFGFCNWCK